MSRISAEEWQLLSFFEVEPQLRDEEEPSLCNDALYQVQQGELTLSASIAPYIGDVWLILRYQGTKLYEFSALDVEDVRYRNEDGIETLEIVTCAGDHLTLRIKPHIQLSHRAKRR